MTDRACFPRHGVWWMLRIFGAGNAYVLDGGFDAWKLQGLPVETGKPTAPARASFTATVKFGPRSPASTTCAHLSMHDRADR